MRLESLVFLLAMEGGSAACQSNVSEREARVKAVEFLSAQSWKDHYLQEIEKVSESGCSWAVWFKRVDWQQIKPSRGLILVSKNTGEVSWVPQK